MNIKGSPVKKSSIPKEITRILQREESSRFKDLKDQLQISGPTLSLHLKSMVNENIIQFEKKGREKHYSLGEKSAELFENQVGTFSMTYEGFLLDLNPKEYTFEELLSAISDNVSPFFLYIILKSIKTGKNWFSAFDSDEILRISADFLIHGLFNSTKDLEELRVYLGKREIDKFASRAYQLSKNKRNKDLTNELFELLSEQYPSVIKLLEEFDKEAVTE